MSSEQHNVEPERLSEDPPATMEITMRAIVYLLARQWRYLVLGAVLGLAFALFALFWTTPSYTVTMEVTPVRSQNGNPGLAGIAQASGISELLGIRGGKNDSTFIQFKTMLTTVALAQQLENEHHVMRVIYKGLWDPKTQTFAPMKIGFLPRTIDWLHGINTNVVPNPVMLAGFLKQRINVVSNPDDTTMLLTMDWPDPEFAKVLLTDVAQEANEILRVAAAARSQQLIAYLRDRLATQITQDSRQALTNLLAEQEQALLLSQPGISYAAAVIDPPFASDLPTSPRPVLTLAVGLLVGIVLSAVFVIVADAVSADMPGTRWVGSAIPWPPWGWAKAQRLIQQGIAARVTPRFAKFLSHGRGNAPESFGIRGRGPQDGAGGGGKRGP